MTVEGRLVKGQAPPAGRSLLSFNDPNLQFRTDPLGCLVDIIDVKEFRFFHRDAFSGQALQLSYRLIEYRVKIFLAWLDHKLLISHLFPCADMNEVPGGHLTDPEVQPSLTVPTSNGQTVH